MYITYAFLWYLCFLSIDKYTNISIKNKLYIVAFLHACVCILVNLASYCIYDRYQDWDENFNPITYHSIALSLGYFIYDVPQTILYDYDINVIYHHLLLILSLVIIYHSEQCSKIVIIFIFLGELSNPFHIIWYLSREYKYSTLEQTFFPLFAISFITLRTLIAPGLMIYILYNYYQNLYIRFLAIIYTFGLSSSVPWCRKLLVKLKKRYVTYPTYINKNI